jgi:two-component system sensor kinase FixL
VLDNLIGNAIRAMDGAPVRNLSITWSAIDGMLMTDVTDTGCGIDPDDHERILDTRYSSREGGGHGLPRSRKVLRKYGGSLIVHTSEPGRGSALRLTLPLA